MDDEQTEMEKVIKVLLDPKNIGHLTELNRNEIIAFSTLSTIAIKRVQLDTLRVWLAENLVFRVSKGRGGRKEMIKVTSRQLQFADERAMQDQGRGRSWFGRRR
jgi:hypothetical protein